MQSLRYEGPPTGQLLSGGLKAILGDVFSVIRGSDPSHVGLRQHHRTVIDATGTTLRMGCRGFAVVVVVV